MPSPQLPQSHHSEPESLRAIALGMVQRYRANKEHAAFCELVEEHERVRVDRMFSPADRNWLSKMNEAFRQDASGKDSPA